jgi:putative ABC transport system substrate-binding protein
VSFLVWVFLFGLVGTQESQAQTVVMLTTDSLTSTTRSISGLQTVIRGNHANASFYVVRVNSTDQSARLSDSIRALNPAVIVPIGTAATSFTRSLKTDIPIVFASVLYPGISGFLGNQQGAKSVSGASLDIPFKIQFEHFQKIVRKIRRIGVLYTEVTKALIEPAREAAKGLGLELIAIRIEQDRELPKALDSLLTSCDGIWSLADPRIFTPQGTKFILLQATKRNVPVMGFSRNVVESGALFALDFDYKAIGRQAGTLVSSILSGKQVGNSEVTVPDIIWFHYNQKSASNLGIVIPQEFVSIAKEVYQ